MRAPDPVFADPTWAALYDDLDGDRDDLAAYVAIVDQLGARRVVDLGCGTGSLALLLAERGVAVVGIDPAAASLNVARAKPGADRVRWVEGDAMALVSASDRFDLAVMTGNVAQVFVDDVDWRMTLTRVHDALRPGGWLVFETRRPDARAWEEWDREPTSVHLADGRLVTTTRTVTDVDGPLVTFETTATIGEEMLRSSSTLRFRERDEIAVDLSAAGFEVVDVRAAADRPGLEHVFVTRRRAPPGIDAD